MAVAIYRAPQPPRKPVGAACMRAMQAAALALTDAVPALVGDEAIAERERYRREDSAHQSVQGVLPLPCDPAPLQGADGRAAVDGSVGAVGTAIRSGSPVDGSSLDTPVAGNSDPGSCVDSGRGSY